MEIPHAKNIVKKLGTTIRQHFLGIAGGYSTANHARPVTHRVRIHIRRGGGAG